MCFQHFLGFWPDLIGHGHLKDLKFIQYTPIASSRDEAIGDFD